MRKLILGLLILVMAVPLMGQRVANKRAVERLYFNEFHVDSLKAADSSGVYIEGVVGELLVDSLRALSAPYIKFAGPLKGDSTIAGVAAFTTTDTEDTVLIAGIGPSDVFVIAINDASPVDDDLISWTVNTDTLFIWRETGTTSALSYSYIRIKL